MLMGGYGGEFLNVEAARLDKGKRSRDLLNGFR